MVRNRPEGWLVAGCGRTLCPQRKASYWKPFGFIGFSEDSILSAANYLPYYASLGPTTTMTTTSTKTVVDVRSQRGIKTQSVEHVCLKILSSSTIAGPRGPFKTQPKGKAVRCWLRYKAVERLRSATWYRSITSKLSGCSIGTRVWNGWN